MRTTHGFTAGRLAWRSLALGVLLAHPAAAQREGESRDGHDDPEQRRQRHLAECRAAAKVIALGIPRTAQKKAHEAITTCSGQAPAAFAAGARASDGVFFALPGRPRWRSPRSGAILRSA
jgi:hypothetical protein